jgi:hypothetical protein
MYNVVSANIRRTVGEVRDMKRHILGLRGLRNRSLNSTIT